VCAKVFHNSRPCFEEKLKKPNHQHDPIRLSKGKIRHVVLTDEAKQSFADWTKDKNAADHVFLRADSNVWGPSHQKRPLDEASERAGIRRPNSACPVLSFFSRVEAKASFVFAINSALLGTIAVHVQRPDLDKWVAVAALVVFSACLSASYYFTYKSSFPNLEGGHSSLVYFREIAKLREPEYLKAFRSQTEEALVDDMISQIWRNFHSPFPFHVFSPLPTVRDHDKAQVARILPIDECLVSDLF
jgi:hypothetical protein